MRARDRCHHLAAVLDFDELSRVAPRVGRAVELRALIWDTHLILAFHSISSAYGFWLPNEPRGSWSDFVASWELFRYGAATKVSTHRSVAHRPYDKRLKREMQSVLKYPPVRFTGAQARIIGMSFQLVP